MKYKINNKKQNETEASAVSRLWQDQTKSRIHVWNKDPDALYGPSDADPWHTEAPKDIYVIYDLQIPFMANV